MPPLEPHAGELREWRVPGGGSSTAREYTASIPPSLASSTIGLTSETAEACALTGLEFTVASRVRRDGSGHANAARLPLVRAETLASFQLDGMKANGLELVKSQAGLPSTRYGRLARIGVDAFTSHIAAADRALGLGAIAAAHTAPGTVSGKRRVARYRTVQTWLGGSDLWPMGADYIPPDPQRVPALMDDLVEFCARMDLDPIAQSAIAHAQLLSIQPFGDGNGRAARTLMNGVWRRRRLAGGLVVPISAALKGDRRRYDSAWRAYREGDVDPMVSLVARHSLSAIEEAVASADRVALMPRAWAAATRPRRGSAAHALIDVLSSQPLVSATEVMRLTGVSQSSAYEAIARLADAGVLRRLSVSRRDTVWMAGDVIDEADRVVANLSGIPVRRSPAA